MVPDDSEHSTYLFILVVPLLCWGIWPTIRQFCGAPVAAFATLNICSQCATAFVYLAVLRTASVAQLAQAVHHPSLRQCAVFFGGFLLGHADQLSSIAMSYIPAGVACTCHH